MYSLLSAQETWNAGFEEVWDTPYGIVRVSSISGPVFENPDLDIDTRFEILREIDNRPDGVI